MEFKINSELQNSNGFGLMLLKAEPEFPQDFGEFNGIKNDFNGIGVFLYKSHTRKPGKWVPLTNFFLMDSL